MYHQPSPLQFAQPSSQDIRTDPFEFPFELREPAGLGNQHGEDQQGPTLADRIYYAAQAKHYVGQSVWRLVKFIEQPTGLNVNDAVLRTCRSSRQERARGR